MKLPATPTTPRGTNATPALAQRLAEIEYRSIADLQPYSRALRKHPEQQLVKLEASIRQFGFNNPILVDDDGTIIAGHARLEAAKRAGIAEVPTIRIAHLSPAEVKAFRLAEQRLGELATWDKDALVLEIQEIIALDEVKVDLTGWDTAEIDIMLDAAGSDCADLADDVIDPPTTPIARSGDLWLLGSATTRSESLPAEQLSQLFSEAGFMGGRLAEPADTGVEHQAPSPADGT